MTKAEPTGNTGDDMFIVGIGASAGGLEAIREVLYNAPKDAPAAYVVLQHMSATQRSMLTDLIARETHLPTTEISRDVRPERNQVYVIPPGSDLIYSDGFLKLVPYKEGAIVPKPSVDRFFRTLAEGVRNRAIGVVLSGTGSDGAAGVKAIREVGGITFAQDDMTAKYNGMPHSAIETGCIDLILSPEEIGQRLDTLSRSSLQGSTAILGDVTPAPIAEILQIVFARTRVDFRDYKPTTILRRLERRMNAVGIETREEYAVYCRENDAEVQELFRDFLISVTRFFRDPQHYEDLETVVEEIVSDRTDEAIRIWIAGCATGEEAYSIGMMFCEAMGGVKAAKQRPLKIFATDIDARALKAARRGRYPRGALADVPSRYVEPYFDVGEDFVTVVPELRQMILFSAHNVVQDPPFMNIDLVCCRNLLIYFSAGLQDRTLSNFHYGLNSNGRVFLGTAENATVSDDLFTEVEVGKKILRKRASQTVRYDRRVHHARNLQHRSLPREPAAATQWKLPEGHAVNSTVEAIVAGLGKSALLLSEEMSILHVFGEVGPYISLREGSTHAAPDHTLLIDPLATEVRILSTMLNPDNRSVRGSRRAVPLLDGTQVQMELILLTGSNLAEDFYLLVFDQLDDHVVSATLEENADEAGSVQALREELATTRNALGQTLQSWETVSEKLKSSNEKMQANNEELRSMKEELETSNEELQSTNEELVTINEAFQIKSVELGELNKELEAILEQIDAPLVVYDLKLRISKFSRSAGTLFQIGSMGLLPHLSQITLPDGFPRLVPICKDALEGGKSVTVEFQSKGRSVRLSCTPFTDTRGSVLGGTIFVVPWDRARDTAGEDQSVLQST